MSRPNVLLFPDPRHHEHPGLDLSTRPPRSDADLPLRRPPAADPNAPPKVAYPWLDPSNPGNWKEEHVVFTILGGWGLVIFGAKQAFS